jgi:hypothetical protein
MAVALTQRGPALALEIVDRAAPAATPPSPLDDRIVAALAEANGSMPFPELRRLQPDELLPALAVVRQDAV